MGESRHLKATGSSKSTAADPIIVQPTGDNGTEIRRCRVKGCPGRMRGNVRCPVCRVYPKGFQSAMRIFNDGTTRRPRRRR